MKTDKVYFKWTSGAHEYIRVFFFFETSAVDYNVVEKEASRLKVNKEDISIGVARGGRYNGRSFITFLVNKPLKGWVNGGEFDFFW